MKTTSFTTLAILLLISFSSFAQKAGQGERFGKTLNLGLGIGGYAGYYGYVNHSLPVINVNYEFDAAKNFTLAPFVSFATYRSGYYYNLHNYYYHETIIPLGVKGSYYFDRLLNASSRWDFYLGASLGFVIRNEYWDNGYEGDVHYYRSGSPLFLDLHIGSEYHFNRHIGAYLDLSTGVSTIGLAFH